MFHAYDLQSDSYFLLKIVNWVFAEIKISLYFRMWGHQFCENTFMKPKQTEIETCEIKICIISIISDFNLNDYNRESKERILNVWLVSKSLIYHRIWQRFTERMSVIIIVYKYLIRRINIYDKYSRDETYKYIRYFVIIYK